MPKIELDTLKCVQLLMDRGLETKMAEAIVESLTDIPVRNLYNKSEVDNMLSDAVEKTIHECRREFDEKIHERRRELDERHREFDKQYLERYRESKERFSSMEKSIESGRRWMVGTIITCTVALATYLSALIHFIH